MELMSCRRSGVSVIAHDGFVYAIGGFDGQSRLFTGERYNPTTNTWRRIPAMYTARSNFAIEVSSFVSSPIMAALFQKNPNIPVVQTARCHEQ